MVLEGGLKKAGKIYETFSSKIGQVAGAALLGGVMRGLLGPDGAVKGAKMGLLYWEK